ncbi:MAG TPA: hypothetical protein VHI13_09460 [Candidatus Kapabacteria bacterium]|nr:hypothetical protein [Candidatus Kapabacteria bacterium]
MKPSPCGLGIGRIHRLVLRERSRFFEAGAGNGRLATDYRLQHNEERHVPRIRNVAFLDSCIRITAAAACGFNAW